MEDFDIPLFDLKVTRKYLFVAGGGGKEDYGIDNGIIAIDRKTNKRIFFKTQDIIKSISIQEIGKICLDDIKAKTSSCKSKCESPREKLDKKLIEQAKTNAKGTNVDDGYLIAAVGTDFFYMVKFNGVFIEITKTKATLKKVVLDTNLYALDKKGYIYGFANVLENRAIEFDSEGNGSKNCQVAEICIKNDAISFKDKNGRMHKTLSNASNFFVSDNSMHIVQYGDMISSFTYDGEMVETSGKINYILEIHGNLIYYSHTEKGSLLSINGIEMMLPKITDISISGDFLVVSTVYGDIYVYEAGEEINKMNVSDVPITGVGISGEDVKFTVLNGVLGSVSMKKRRHWSRFILLSFIVVAIGVGYTIYKNRK
ncbi:hypothetical protein ECANGB1_60 [Enterospora canceri]|uniref:Uncharacterized protein n=1 Tax=Enterospora canceri TaxID=1081671 RepID=A0A1Y1S967_9MICR|nr:hypothetical protein ECANGB1_60 [Enterospora canceri]